MTKLSNNSGLTFKQMKTQQMIGLKVWKWKGTAGWKDGLEAQNFC